MKIRQTEKFFLLMLRNRFCVHQKVTCPPKLPVKECKMMKKGFPPDIFLRKHAEGSVHYVEVIDTIVNISCVGSFGEHSLGEQDFTHCPHFLICTKVPVARPATCYEHGYLCDVASDVEHADLFLILLLQRYNVG